MNIQFMNATCSAYKSSIKGNIRPGVDGFKPIFKTIDISADNICFNNETPTREIDFEYNSTEELLDQISKRYDMEKMKPWDLCQVLGMLKQGGVISSDEYWLGQSIIPINGSTSDAPRPQEFENALEDYYSNFETYVENNAYLYPPEQAQRLHDSMLVHKKMEGIFKQIQSYR